MKPILDYIEQHIRDDITISDLAALADLKTSRFYERFQNETGFSPANYIKHRKIQLAKEMLKKNKMTVTEVAYELGFSSSQYFATVFKRVTGRQPRSYLA